MRAHVVLPPDLVRESDALVGKRRRSKFLAEAVREKLARIKLARAAEQAAGALADIAVPGWETSESAARWVRTARSGSRSRLPMP